MSPAWRLKVQEGVGLLELDQPDTEVNILTAANLAELHTRLDEISRRSDLGVLLITSAKPRIFIAGADIKEIQTISSPEEAQTKADQGKEIFQKLEDLPIPTIAVINGACLGGGYELALAANFRVASFSEQVKIGLPEVNLGILPGFGGSIRLPRTLGLLKALPLILAGKVVSSKEALKLGMVDRLFFEKTLVEDSLRFAREILSRGAEKMRLRRKKPLLTWFLEDTPLGRSIVLHRAEKDVRHRTRGFYPAPLEIIKLVGKTYGRSGKEVFRLESGHFARLGASEVSKNLIRVFFLTERYKKKSWTSIKTAPSPVRKCGVVGAGVMGGGIAQLVSYKNIPVRVKDIQEAALGHALKEAGRIYQEALKRRKIARHEFEFKMGLISTGLTQEGLRGCDVVIEAVVENLGIKQKVFKELGELTRPETVLATNTSSLPVTEMARVTKHPERVIGLHFFNPVHRMPLVEVVRTAETSEETLEKTIQFARTLGKTAIVTKDSPGFVVNRILLPYLNEAGFLLEEGVPIETLDRIAGGFGMPMGPCELLDQIGIDVAMAVAKILHEALGERAQPPSLIQAALQKELKGKKSKRGFYLYEGKNKKANPEIAALVRRNSPPPEDQILKRLIYIMINEAARCLEERVVEDADTVDLAMILGTGFPPFRGGLLHYAPSIGISKITEDLNQFASELKSARFSPCSFLLQQPRVAEA